MRTSAETDCARAFRKKLQDSIKSLVESTLYQFFEPSGISWIGGSQLLDGFKQVDFSTTWALALQNHRVLFAGADGVAGRKLKSVFMDFPVLLNLVLVEIRSGAKCINIRAHVSVGPGGALQ